jgi:hypothetical protein
VSSSMSIGTPPSRRPPRQLSTLSPVPQQVT